MGSENRGTTEEDGADGPTVAELHSEVQQLQQEVSELQQKLTRAVDVPATDGEGRAVEPSAQFDPQYEQPVIDRLHPGTRYSNRELASTVKEQTRISTDAKARERVEKLTDYRVFENVSPGVWQYQP